MGYTKNLCYIFLPKEVSLLLFGFGFVCFLQIVTSYLASLNLSCRRGHYYSL